MKAYWIEKEGDKLVMKSATVISERSHSYEVDLLADNGIMNLVIGKRGSQSEEAAFVKYRGYLEEEMDKCQTALNELRTECFALDELMRDMALQETNNAKTN